MEQVCIIIVTYNAEKWFSKSLDRLKDVPSGYKIIVVDNCSTDDTCELLRVNYPDVHMISSPVNLGFGQANNLGLEEALKYGYSWFLLLNQDAYISWENINKLVEVAKLNTHYGIISPIHLFSDSQIDFTHRKHILSKNEELLSDLLLTGSCKEIYDFKITNAAIWLLPRFTIEIVGGFDPLFFHYGEDNDYCLRTLQNNLKIGICPKIIGYHYRPQDDSNFIKNQNYYYVNYLISVIYGKRILGIMYLSFLKENILNILRNRPALEVVRFRFLALWKLILNYNLVKLRRRIHTDKYRYLKLNGN